MKESHYKSYDDLPLFSMQKQWQRFWACHHLAVTSCCTTRASR